MGILKRKFKNKGANLRVNKALLCTGLSILFYAQPFSEIYAVPSLTISQVPLILSNPIHPQVLIAIGNSQSMDGTLSGAIMTGSGSLGTLLGSLINSSSPVYYTVPSGFTPPLQAANSSGLAPYTVLNGGVLNDNGPSRLNVAKGGVTAILQTYMQSADFALEVYNTSGATPYTTWVYFMSPSGSDFKFATSIPSTIPANTEYVNNPCYNYLTSSVTVLANCTAIQTYFNTTQHINIGSYQYLQLSNSSDDTSINDVLYAPATFPGIFLTYSGPNPSSPYPPNFSVGNYNSGSILESYSQSLPSIGGFSTSPTNAGFVPFSPQVLYVQRGYGYYGSQAANTGTLLVPMTTAGTNPTSTSTTTAINAFLPFLTPETNSASTSEIKSVATQSPIAGLLTKANSYLSSLSTTSGNGCPQKKYVILISDGLPTEDLSGELWPPLGSASAAGYGVTATFNSDGSLNSTNDQALTDAINTIKTLNTNGIQTYVIGLGAGVDPALNPQAAASLTAMAVAGGTGNYYPATSATALVNDLNNIMVAIQNGIFSGSAAAISSTHLTGTTVEYQADFASSGSPYKDWVGDLLEIALDPITGLQTSQVYWSAQAQVDTFIPDQGWNKKRVLATWVPPQIILPFSILPGYGTPFEWNSLSLLQQTQLYTLPESSSVGKNRLSYLRGDTSNEVRNGGSFRNRSHLLGDIINSQVLYVGAPNDPYLTNSYVAFSLAQANRQPMVYVGANDGILHAFNAQTGAEIFGFIPNALFKNLSSLTSTLYNASHLYFVDSSPQSADAQFSDGSWHSLLVGGEGAGGNSIYALDITNPSNYGVTGNNNSAENNLASAVLWEFTDGDMGLTYSLPQIAQISNNSSTIASFAVFFGNGYNSPTNSSVFYAIDPKTGAVLRKIDLCATVSGACNSSLPQGLSTLAVGQNNGLQGQPITAVYGGDLQGNLWVINVSDPSPANWSARLLFQARDSTGAIQPITTPPVVSLNPNYPRSQGLFVMFGTGQLLTGTDLLNSQTQTIYGVWDKPSSSTTYSRSNLQQQTLNIVGSSLSGLPINILTVTSNTINWSSQVGWYDDLPTPGQGLVTSPSLFNGSFIATLNTPPLATCGGSFSSMFLEINYATGGSFPRSQLTFTIGGVTNSNYKYGGAYPVGFGIANTFANAPTVLGTNKNNNIVILVTQSNGNQTSVLNPNNSPRKVGWWQLQ